MSAAIKKKDKNVVEHSCPIVPHLRPLSGILRVLWRQEVVYFESSQTGLAVSSVGQSFPGDSKSVALIINLMLPSRRARSHILLECRW